jgi:hypothetical protein
MAEKNIGIMCINCRLFPIKEGAGLGEGVLKAGKYLGDIATRIIWYR